MSGVCLCEALTGQASCYIWQQGSICCFGGLLMCHTQWWLSWPVFTCRISCLHLATLPEPTFSSSNYANYPLPLPLPQPAAQTHERTLSIIQCRVLLQLWHSTPGRRRLVRNWLKSWHIFLYTSCAYDLWMYLCLMERLLHLDWQHDSWSWTVAL